MKKRQYIILAVVLGIIFLIGFAISNRNNSGGDMLEPIKQGNKYVKTKKARYDQYPLVIRGSGRIGSSRNLMLVAEVQGKLSQGEVSLKSGSSFRQGQLLCTVDNTEAALRLQARKSNFLTMLAGALADLKIDFPEYFDEWEAFFNKIDVSQSLPNLPAVNSTKGKTYLASRNILSEYYGIRADEATLRKYNVYAPFDGSIMDVMTDLGSVVNPGSQIARIIQTGNLEVEVAVEVEDSRNLQVGDTAILTGGKNKTEMRGRVVRIGKYVNSNTQSVDVFVAVDPNYVDLLYDGMYVEVELLAGNLENVIRLPRRAVFNHKEIYAVVKDSLLVSEKIEVVRRDQLWAFIKGVEEGKTIVIEPVSNATDSMIVKSLPQDE